MATYEIIERPLQSGNNPQGPEVERTRRFIVKTDDPGATIDDIEAINGIPKPYSAHPTSPTLKATSIQTNQKSRFIFDVVVPYSNQIDKEEVAENPLERPAKIVPRGTQRTIPTLLDSKGEPYTNTAGDIVLGQTIEITEMIFSVSKNVASPPRFLPEYWRGVVNSDDIRILGFPFKARHLKFQFGSLEETSDAKTRFYVLNFSLVERFDSWDTIYANVGRREKDPAVSSEDLGFLAEVLTEEELERYSKDTLKDILVGDPPRPTDDPVWLDEDGRAIREESTNSALEGPIKTKLEPAEIIINKREGIPEQPFSRLSSLLS